MTQRVDHEERRQLIAQGMWRIIHRDGISAMTTRSLAVETGWSVGSIRHYFKSQDDLLLFAMQQMIIKIVGRIGNLDFTTANVDVLVNALEQLMPLDEQRKAEAQVWLSIQSRRLADPVMRQKAYELDLLVRNAARQVLTELSKAELLRPHLDLDVETTRLHALLDGLTLHGAATPSVVSPDATVAAMRTHLHELLAANDSI